MKHPKFCIFPFACECDYMQFVKLFLVINCLLTQYMSSFSTSFYCGLSQVQVTSSLYLVIEKQISGESACKK